MRVGDVIFFDVEYLLNQMMGISLYIHQPGQLMKHLMTNMLKYFKSAVYRQRLDDYSKGKGIKSLLYTLHQLEVLNKRPNMNNPCDPKLENEDNAIRREIVKLVGCIPTYWKRFNIVGANMASHSSCNTREELANLSTFLPRWEGNYFVDKTQHLYISPCQQLKISGELNDDAYLDFGDHGLYMKISHMTDEYKSITNAQAFSAQDLWSQIGGFVGIFLGCSLLQVNHSFCLQCSCPPIATCYQSTC